MKKMPEKAKKNKKTWPLKAYHNGIFLNSEPARIIRIMCEMIEPETRVLEHGISGTIVFFGSARTLSEQQALKDLEKAELELKKSKKPSRALLNKYDNAKLAVEMSIYYEHARDLSEKLSLYFKKTRGRKEKIVVSSGGGPGIMEAANLGAKKAGYDSIGLNISLPMEQDPNPYQTPDLCFEFHYFFIRKFWFVNMARAIVVFPGGFGTMDELFELLTLTQTGKSSKSIPIILYGKKYWDEVVNFKSLVKWGVISRQDLKLFKVYSDVDEAFAYLKKTIRSH